VNNDNDAEDDNGHGTRGGTIGADQQRAGVAGENWSVSLMGVKVLNASGPARALPSPTASSGGDNGAQHQHEPGRQHRSHAAERRPIRGEQGRSAGVCSGNGAAKSCPPPTRSASPWRRPIRTTQASFSQYVGGWWSGRPGVDPLDDAELVGHLFRRTVTTDSTR
jgi:hypothetical protein